MVRQIKNPLAVAGLIRVFRKKNNFSQHRLAKEMGVYVGKSNYSVISLYERELGLPSIPSICKLSQLLPGLDKDVLFNAVLREHYKKFLDRHYSRYMKWTKTGDKKILEKHLIYNFLSVRYRRINIKYNFRKFTKILWEEKQKKGVTYNEMIEDFKNNENIKEKYNKSHFAAVMQGVKTPSLKMIINFATYFNIDPFELYKIFVEEKAMAHAKNLMEEWESYKKEEENETENSKLGNVH